MKLNVYTYNNYETENKYLINKNLSRTGPKLHSMPIVQAAAATELLPNVIQNQEEHKQK